ncbi:MAG: epoxyqueuosine reductase [Deltaproteobacteria bacterium]|nr:epoxyqueuosine reductase [Deltaproteobacteria bacterium]
MTASGNIDVEVLHDELAAWLQGQPASARFCRAPVVGAAAAEDARWMQLRTVAHAAHLLPENLLPGARSVVAWFLPFQSWLAKENRGGEWAAESWGESYVRVNELLAQAGTFLTARLAERGYRAATDPPTGKFDREKLVAPWSHKHAAWVCGVGTFGLHHLLITREGAVGRLGSLVTDAPIAPSPAAPTELCLAKNAAKCRKCIEACPIGALAGEVFDRGACWARCLENAARLAHLGNAQVCGKCMVVCPAVSRVVPSPTDEVREIVSA